LHQAPSSSRTDVCIREEQSEILLQSAVDGVLQRKRQHTWNEVCRHAARERAHPERSGYGLAGSARTGCCLGLSKGCGCAVQQDSGQQERARRSVTHSQGNHPSLFALGRFTSSPFGYILDQNPSLGSDNVCSKSAHRLADTSAGHVPEPSKFAVRVFPLLLWRNSFKSVPVFNHLAIFNAIQIIEGGWLRVEKSLTYREHKIPLS
jgi:hypothetical protein